MPSYARERTSTNPTPTIAISAPAEESSDDGHWAWKFLVDQETLSRSSTPYPASFKSSVTALQCAETVSLTLSISIKDTRLAGQPVQGALRQLEEEMHEHVNQMYAVVRMVSLPKS
jgi:hypothetical protein